MTESAALPQARETAKHDTMGVYFAVSRVSSVHPNRSFTLRETPLFPEVVRLPEKPGYGPGGQAVGQPVRL